MERSNFANVLITTRLIPYFNSDNVAAMKSCIFVELGCTNEAEFLCKVLTMIYGSLSNKSTTIIKNKAVKIADSQSFSLSSANTKSMKNDNDIYNINTVHQLQLQTQSNASTHATSVYKYVKDKYNDSLSNSTSDVIDHIGTFLTKQESILFGYLNKQLYIETQKLSYLLKQCKDSKPFVLNDSSVSKLLWSVSSSYSYNFPRHLEIANYGHGYLKYWWKKIVQRDYFNNFFLRLNYLTCNRLELIEYIPINLLFNNKCNFYDSDESREYIEEFSISGQFKDDENSNKIESSFDKFYQKIEKYKKMDDGNTRKIKCFRFNVEKVSKYKYGRIGLDMDGEAWKMPNTLKQVFLSCCEISESIMVECSIDRLGINSLDELKALFHPNLKRFGFKKGVFSDAINISDISDITDKKCSQLDTVNIGNKLEEIEMTHGVMKSWRMNWTADNKCLFNVLDFFDRLKLRKNIRRYIINWKAYYDRDSDQRDELLNRLFFKDCDKYLLLERVVFKITNYDGLASIMEYLINNKKKIFVDKEIKFKLKHLKTIHIEIDAKHKFLSGFGRLPRLDPMLSLDDENDENDENDDDFVVNEKFVVDEWVIKITNAGECIEYIDRNVSDWCNKILAANKSIGGRRVVLVL